MEQFCKSSKGNQPLVATAIHHGHQLRKEAAGLMKLDESIRLREEDPHTGEWTFVSDNNIVVNRSRFEVDLNRPREKAVYIEPSDCWGLDVWKARPDDEFIARSLDEYDAFYSQIEQLFKDLQKRFGHFVVFDIHSYNHRRDGASAVAAEPSLNPEVNIGTGTAKREIWSPLVKRFMADLSGFDYLGKHLDVRENVKFSGGHLLRWTHKSFPDSACVLAIEFKKYFMDEWSGERDNDQIVAIGKALSSTVPGVLEELNKL
jgi:N-formylglutamate deformylase